MVRGRGLGRKGVRTVEGRVHSFETFGTVDGDGIRFVVFLSGCRLGCRFCHNPDTWNLHSGKVMSVDEILDEVEDYRPYFEATGGGLTISGGDPLVQADFVAELLAAARERGINTCLETSGYGDEGAFRTLISLADQVMYGLKGFSSKVYRKLTVHDNRVVLRNLSILGHEKQTARLRYLVIPGVTDVQDELQQLVHFLRDLPCRFVFEPIAYHTLGVPKWEALGWDYALGDLRSPTDEEMARVARYMRRAGLQVLGDFSLEEEDMIA